MWDLGKHFANVVLEHKTTDGNDAPDGTLESPGAKLSLITKYHQLGILHEVGYPGASGSALHSAGLLDSNGHLYSISHVLSDGALASKVQAYLSYHGASNDGPHEGKTARTAVDNAGGRYVDGFGQGEG